MEKFLKGLPTKAADAFASILKSNTEMAARIAKMEDDKLTETLAKRAADAGEPAAFADILKSLAKVDPKLADTIATFAKAKNAQIANALGRRRGSQTSSPAAPRPRPESTHIAISSSSDKPK